MAGVVFDSVSKLFGSTTALDNINIDIKDGEFIALLGSSGCGKTTLLRLLAGFEPVSKGRILIDNRLVSSRGCHIMPEKRNIGMVFQAYALWPHMSVRENVSFSLRMKKVNPKERDKKVDEALSAVGLSELNRRKPADLSGGQRQRVALARCLAMEPGLVLLDEPLANLDVSLRDSMLKEFRHFHQKIGSSMVYVTHDQQEAMTLADRIMVMEKGRILQDASPERLYNEPNSEAVARFVGKGMVVPVKLERMIDKKRFLGTIFSRQVELRGKIDSASLHKPNNMYQACLRAEDMQISGDNQGFPAIVDNYIYHGGGGTVYLHPVDNPDYNLRVYHRGAAPAAGEKVTIKINDGWILPKK